MGRLRIKRNPANHSSREEGAQAETSRKKINKLEGTCATPRKEKKEAVEREREANLKLLESREKVIEEWKKSSEGEAYAAEVGVESPTVAENDTLRKMKEAVSAASGLKRAIQGSLQGRRGPTDGQYELGL